jgi:hypothetical protein
MQFFSVLTPPDQALASSASDIVPGGVASVNDMLRLYDGQNDIKDIYDYFGITRVELAAMHIEKTCSSDRSIISFGRSHIFSAAEGELVHRIPTRAAGVSTLYSTPLYLHDRFNGGSFCTDSLVGNSAKVGWFSIMKKCGNLQVKRSIQRIPKGNFIAASCKTIQGFAYDERQTNQPVKVYLFFDGPPGKGTQFGPIVANQATPNSPVGAGHGFSFAVPEQYQKSTKSTVVWGVLQPLAGWTEPTVQFENTASIPGNCTPQPVPSASCTNLNIQTIERTKFKAITTAHAENGAKIENYTVTVRDKSGNQVYEKTYPSNTSPLVSDIFEIKQPGSYNVVSVVKTTIGNKTDPACQKPVQVSNQDRCKFNNDLSPTDQNCKSCPYNPDIWAKDEDCVPKITQSKEAHNLTRNAQNASTVTAQPNDRIEYTLRTANLGNTPYTTTITENLSDVLEYASVFDTGGGTFNQSNNALSWPQVTLAPGQVDIRKITVQLNETFPATPVAGNNPSSYNCIITNAYGNTINIKLECPPSKVIENTVQQLPSTGPGENMLFGGGLLMVVTYFYARSRQMNKEVRLIRREFSGGTV